MNTTENTIRPRLHRRLDAIWAVSPRWLAVSFLLVVTAVSFWGTLDAFFVQDDFCFLGIVQQPMPNVGMLRGACFFRPLPGYWIPLLNVSLWGLQPFWHHAMYFTMFLATIGALFFWLRGTVKSTAAALVGSSLYALSKTHLYTLGWIAGGIDVSAAMFLVFALWATDAYLNRSDANAGRAEWKMLLVIAITFACGLLSKESCIIFAPACAAWVAARMLGDRRRFSSAELKLGILLAVILAVYLPAWKMTTSLTNDKAMQPQFDLSRGQKVLESSVIAVVPATEKSTPQSELWPLAGALMACLATMPLIGRFRFPRFTLKPKHSDSLPRRRRDRKSTTAKSRLFGYIILGLSLWGLPALLFVFTRYPWDLQLYYAHFCIFGLALLATLAVEAIQDRLRGWCFEPRSTPSRARTALGWSTIGGMILLFLVWIGATGVVIRSSVRNHASPALLQAEYSKSVFDTIDPYLRNKTYSQVVFLDISEIVWVSIYYGGMIAVYYPQVDVACNGRGGYEVPEQIHTTSTTLVVRQTGQSELTIVR